MAGSPDETARAAKTIEQQLQAALRDAKDSELTLTAAALEFALFVLDYDRDRVARIERRS